MAIIGTRTYEYAGLTIVYTESDNRYRTCVDGYTIETLTYSDMTKTLDDLWETAIREEAAICR